MKHIIIIILAFATLFFVQSCKKEEIYLYNTQNTPDLSNPIIQKVSNTVWYNAIGDRNVMEIWSSQNNIYKPADFASSILYQMAWTSLTLRRDGTSNMVYVPPFASHVVVHAQGNWAVSTEEENTIILSTKTPVSSVTGKIKILNLETKDNVSTLKISLDFGDRLMTAQLSNENPYDYLQEPLFKALDASWFDGKTVSGTAIDTKEFFGTWAGHDNASDLTDYDMARYTHMEDLLSNTPTFINGISFNIEEGGNAQIVYSGRSIKSFFNEWTQAGKTVYSNAKWSVSGNKILVESDEEVFLSYGELLFGFVPHSTNLTLLGYDKNATPIRTRAKQLYSMEVIEKAENGYWMRVTTKTETFYAFFKKSTFDQSTAINIKDLF
jgi:hypothetical protein